jgi:N utilization substance protein B
MKIEIEDNFPLSKERSVKGSRRLAREKVLQILTAYEVSETPWPQIFPHIFGRRFNFGDEEPATESETPGKILKRDEIYELEADVPIKWDDEEIKFARRLLESAIEKKEYFNAIIEENAKNWELDRIALIDRLLIYIAAAELVFFEDIPTKVSINEAIDIAKKYSTDKSGVFINGLMEAVIKKLSEDNLINKKGRGLIDNSEDSVKAENIDVE